MPFDLDAVDEGDGGSTLKVKSFNQVTPVKIKMSRSSTINLSIGLDQLGSSAQIAASRFSNVSMGSRASVSSCTGVSGVRGSTYRRSVTSDMTNRTSQASIQSNSSRRNIPPPLLAMSPNNGINSDIRGVQLSPGTNLQSPTLSNGLSPRKESTLSPTRLVGNSPQKESTMCPRSSTGPRKESTITPRSVVVPRKESTLSRTSKSSIGRDSTEEKIPVRWTVHRKKIISKTQSFLNGFKVQSPNSPHSNESQTSTPLSRMRASRRNKRKVALHTNSPVSRERNGSASAIRLSTNQNSNTIQRKLSEEEINNKNIESDKKIKESLAEQREKRHLKNIINFTSSLFLTKNPISDNFMKTIKIEHDDRTLTTTERFQGALGSMFNKKKEESENTFLDSLANITTNGVRWSTVMNDIKFKKSDNSIDQTAQIKNKFSNSLHNFWHVARLDEQINTYIDNVEDQVDTQLISNFRAPIKSLFNPYPFLIRGKGTGKGSNKKRKKLKIQNESIAPENIEVVQEIIEAFQPPSDSPKKRGSFLKSGKYTQPYKFSKWGAMKEFLKTQNFTEIGSNIENVDKDEDTHLKRDIVRKHPFLSSFSFETRVSLLSSLECHFYKADEIILVEDTLSKDHDNVYLIEKGAVAVTKKNEDLGVLDQNDVFGTTLILKLSRIHLFTVRCQTPSIIWSIKRSILQATLSSQELESVSKVTEQQLKKLYLNKRSIIVNQIDIFKKTSQKFKDALAEKFRVYCVASKDPCMRNMNFIAYLRYGRASVDIDGYNLTYLTKDQLFGDVTFLTLADASTNRDWSLYALTDCIFLLLTYNDFIEVLNDFPEESDHFHKLQSLAAEQAPFYHLAMASPNFKQFDDSLRQSLTHSALNMIKEYGLNQEIEIPQDYFGFVYEGTVTENNTLHLENREQYVYEQHSIIGLGHSLGLSDIQWIPEHMIDMTSKSEKTTILFFHKFTIITHLNHHPKFGQQIPNILSCDWPEIPNLKNLPIFQHVVESMDEIMDGLVWLTGLPGQTLLREGESGTYMVIVAFGSYEVVINRITCNVVNAPSAFGEMAALNLSSIRTATVVLTTPCLWCMVEADDFQKWSDYQQKATQALKDNLSTYRQKGNYINTHARSDRDGLVRSPTPDEVIPPRNLEATTKRNQLVVQKDNNNVLGRVRSPSYLARRGSAVNRDVNFKKRGSGGEVVNKPCSIEIWRNALRLRLFLNMNSHFVEILSSQTEYRAFLPKAMIYEEGSLAKEFYFVRNGQAVQFENSSGNTCDIFAGGMFGEMDLTKDVERTSSVRAVKLCEVAILHSGNVSDICDLYTIDKQEITDVFKSHMITLSNDVVVNNNFNEKRVSEQVSLSREARSSINHINRISLHSAKKLEKKKKRAVIINDPKRPSLKYDQLKFRETLKSWIQKKREKTMRAQAIRGHRSRGLPPGVSYVDEEAVKTKDPASVTAYGRLERIYSDKEFPWSWEYNLNPKGSRFHLHPSMTQ